MCAARTSCHWNVYAESGPATRILTLGNPDHPGVFSKLHFPVGGPRMRPCPEDFLEFVLHEFGVDRLPNAPVVLAGGRERWRRRQIGTLVRDAPDEAVRVLRELGNAVTDPARGPVRRVDARRTTSLGTSGSGPTPARSLRSVSEGDTVELLNRAMDAIEEDPASPVDVPALARVALTSEHHFRRMFSALAGIPLSEYVRRRRLTVAAAAVLDGVEAVQDIAVRHGYGSADAFSRAFKAFHGIGPEQARRPGAVLRAQPRLTFHLRIEGSSDMQYRIVKKDAFGIAGLRTRIPLIYEGVNPVGAEFTRTLTDAQWERLETLSDQEPRGALTVLDGIDESRAEGSMLDYYVAATTSQPVPPDLEGLEIAAGTWVVFSATGPFPTALQELWPKAYGEWFPANPYRTAPGPELVRSDYHDDEGTSADFELWLPVEATG